MLFSLSVSFFFFIFNSMIFWWFLFFFFTTFFVFLLSPQAPHTILIFYYILQEILGGSFLLFSGSSALLFFILMAKSATPPFHFWGIFLVENLPPRFLVWFITFHTLPFLVPLFTMMIVSKSIFLLSGGILFLTYVSSVSFKHFLFISSSEVKTWGVLFSFLDFFSTVIILTVYLMILSSFLSGAPSMITFSSTEALWVFFSSPFTMPFFVKFFFVILASTSSFLLVFILLLFMSMYLFPLVMVLLSNMTSSTGLMKQSSFIFLFFMFFVLF